MTQKPRPKPLLIPDGFPEWQRRRESAPRAEKHPIVEEPEMCAEMLLRNPDSIHFLNDLYWHKPQIDYFDDWDPYGDPSSPKRGNTPGKSSDAIQAQQTSLPITRSISSSQCACIDSLSAASAAPNSSANFFSDRIKTVSRFARRAFTSSRMRLASSSSMDAKSTRPENTPEFYAGYGKDVQIPGWEFTPGGKPFTGTQEEHETLMRQVFADELSVQPSHRQSQAAPCRAHGLRRTLALSLRRASRWLPAVLTRRGGR